LCQKIPRITVRRSCLFSLSNRNVSTYHASPLTIDNFSNRKQTKPNLRLVPKSWSFLASPLAGGFDYIWGSFWYYNDCFDFSHLYTGVPWWLACSSFLILPRFLLWRLNPKGWKGNARLSHFGPEIAVHQARMLNVKEKVNKRALKTRCWRFRKFTKKLSSLL